MNLCLIVLKGVKFTAKFYSILTTMPTSLTYEEIPATSTPLYSIICLHGLGADGDDFKGMVPQLNIDHKQHINFIFPNAPMQAVTINDGVQMRSWYDILKAPLNAKVAVGDIYQSSMLLAQIIQGEIDKGIKADKILLVGFSQGGVIALHTGLRFSQKLAGIIALSTHLPTTEQLKTERAMSNHNTPIFMAHGTMDLVIYAPIAKDAFNRLKAMGYPISWHEYPMQHSLCLEEMIDIAHFIQRVLKLG